MAVPVPNSRTPLLAAHHSAQKQSPSGSPHASHATRQSRSSSPQAFAVRSRPPNPSSTSFLRRRKGRRSPRIQFVPGLIALVLLAFVIFLAWDVSSIGDCYFQALCDVLGEGERMDTVWWENSGPYAPWRSGGAGGGKRGLPRGCEINQVTLLHRHAARYPTTAAAESMKRALKKIKDRAIIAPRRHAELAFLAKADLDMTDWALDGLLDQGRKAAWRSGKEMQALYYTLLRSGEGIFSRAGRIDRVEESAGYWLEGFLDQPFKLKPLSSLPKVNLTIPEDETSNNTLSVHNCPAFNNQPDKNLSGILDMLTPARDRLNKLLDPRPSLEVDDLICLADMCAFDSQVDGEDWAAWSRWCGIFDRDEWAIIGHYRDTKRYYEVGDGSPYGATMGAGWVNELVARLTDSAPVDAVNINRTLDFDEATFPRGGRRFFLDYGHDNEMIEVITAMGLLKQQRPLSTDSLPDKRTFVTAEIIPFGSRMTFERIGCHLGDWEPDPENPDGGGDGRKNYVRILVNDVIQPIEHIACQQSGFVEHKMCEVELFLESQEWAQGEANWDVCYERT